MKKVLLFLLLALSLQAETVVITLHGYMRTPKSMCKLGRSLCERGDVVYHFSYPSREKSIAENSDIFLSYLQEVEQKHPEAAIHFVTHSLGGIILRSTLNHPNCPDVAKQGRAVLLAPPNQGSRFAKSISGIVKKLGSGSGHELAKGEKFTCLGSFPPTMQVIVIAGTFGFNPLISFPNDGKVALHETLLETPHKFFEIFACHSMIMRNSRAISLTKEILHEKISSGSTPLLGSTPSE